MPLKAYVVSWGEPVESGCILVWAETRGQAKGYTQFCGPWINPPYTELIARRVPAYDQYAEDTPFAHRVETNDELPEGAPAFFTNAGYD